MAFEIHYEAVFRDGLAPLLLLTPDLVVVAVNDSYLKTTGWTRADLLGRPIFTAMPRDPHDPDLRGLKALRASLEQVAATGEPSAVALQRHDVEVPGRPGTFEERYWSAVNSPVFDPGGRVHLIIHRAEDVTAFVRHLRRGGQDAASCARAEQGESDPGAFVRARELLAVSERLHHAYTQQGHTMAALREAAEQQRRFVLDASHDLRNPITGLLTKLEVGLSEPDTDLRPILHKALRDAERLKDIVADLLELARLDTTAPTATEPIHLARLVADELERRTLTAAVVTRLDRRAVVNASPIRLARLLGNLIANAERHTTTTIEIVVTADPPEAVLEVIDDGPGIDPADHERVFERLARLDEGRRLDPSGSGLGLPIAREIAQAYGGRLYAADHPTGARFVLRLPLAT
ncbi:PAS domain-containing sensor histidine kinase [Sphaerisporangium corydalis]|uniref:Sensor-like histidine kinase SenX3 n=1 Tax=Sphaerisporangium corydalis TaxID=1441875 RepID=A0ABV9EAD3_9ACTN|nr:PAS domain-containing sensor histidine kinase [Sphaerisporangium corydalis]